MQYSTSPVAESTTMLKDVAWLDAERTRRVLKWAARAMLRGAMQLDGTSEEQDSQAGRDHY
jgi:hypothetical protein